MEMKAQNRCCPLMQDTCDHCGFHDIANGICEYIDCVSMDENIEMLHKENTNGRASKDIQE